MAYARALAILEKSVGADHADTADAIIGLGRAKVRTGDFDAAARLLERGRALRDKTFGPAHPLSSEHLLGFAELHLAHGEAAQAIPLLERAASLGNAGLRAELLLTLAEALWRTNGDRARAKHLAEEARSLSEAAFNARAKERADRWLARHKT